MKKLTGVLCMKNVLRFLEPVWWLNGQYGSHFDRHFERDFITVK